MAAPEFAYRHRAAVNIGIPAVATRALARASLCAAAASMASP